MRGSRITIVLAAVAVAVIGCDRKPVAASPPASPPPRVAVVPASQPATLPAEPPAAFFTINGQAFPFPAAKLVTKTTEASVRVTLFSDDPPEAVRDGYLGNSFYFRFTLDGDNADLAGQQFVYRNSFTENDDATNGLFIAGGKQTLRPVDVSVTFERVDGQLLTRVGGTFKLTDERTGVDAPVTVRARAELEPAVVDQSKK